MGICWTRTRTWLSEKCGRALSVCRIFAFCIEVLYFIRKEMTEKSSLSYTFESQEEWRYDVLHTHRRFSKLNTDIHTHKYLRHESQSHHLKLNSHIGFPSTYFVATGLLRCCSRCAGSHRSYLLSWYICCCISQFCSACNAYKEYVTSMFFWHFKCNLAFAVCNYHYRCHFVSVSVYLIIVFL